MSVNKKIPIYKYFMRQISIWTGNWTLGVGIPGFNSRLKMKFFSKGHYKHEEYSIIFINLLVQIIKFPGA